MVLVLLPLLCAGTSRAAEDLSAWPYGTDLILNTSSTGANVASTVTGFTMLVRLNSNNFPFSQAQGDGRDIRFATPGGAPLAHEIERWDAFRQMAEIWVKVDTVKGNHATQSLRMLWGNSAAAGSPPGGVFLASGGFVGAWHLSGSGTAARPNSVAGGPNAVPRLYDGNENGAGVIAGADSLDGDSAAADHLDIGKGYADFSGGFTFSVWAYPTAARKWSRLLELGNGPGKENIFVARVDTTANLGLHNYNGTTPRAAVHAVNQFTLNQWQQFAVTISGKNARLYKDGALVASDTMTNTMANAARDTNYLGRSSWLSDQGFRGKLDQAEISKVARGDAWIKLAYQNQKPGQTLPTVIKPLVCAAKLTVPADTTVPEGGSLVLTAALECANSFSWSVVSGPAARILDPEVKSLAVTLPRVAGDTAVVYRLTAAFSDSVRVRDVRVRIKEAIPEPVFAMPAVASWTGRDSLAYKPAISNLAALRACRDSALHWNWTLTGPEADTAWLPDGLLFRSAASNGRMQIRLCLDNDGPEVCKSSVLDVSPSTAAREISAARAIGPAKAGNRPYRDAAGRLRKARPSRLFEAGPAPRP